MKLVVVTNSTDGRFFAISSMPSSTASVARCTSTGLASNEAVERRTAKLSTSSISTTVNGRRAAISGTVSVSSRVTLRWLSPSMSLGNACGLISISAVAPWRASASAATCARPRASVVLPVPGGPASTISPCGRPDEHRELAAVLQHQQRLREQPLLHLARDDDRVPVAVVVLGRQDVHRQHARRQRGARAAPSLARPLVLRPLDLRQLLHRDQRVFRFLEQHHRIHQRAHRLEHRVEHVDAHQPALVHRDRR